MQDSGEEQSISGINHLMLYVTNSYCSIALDSTFCQNDSCQDNHLEKLKGLSSHTVHNVEMLILAG